MSSSSRSNAASRFRRLKERFAQRVHEHQVDHDYDHLTSTRREHIPLRTFYLGEIWWAARESLGDHRVFEEGHSHRPALVTRRQSTPGEPVEVAPGYERSSVIKEGGQFEAPEIKGVPKPTVFVLTLRRPVARGAFGAHLGTLTGAQKQRLATILEALRSAANSRA